MNRILATLLLSMALGSAASARAPLKPKLTDIGFLVGRWTG